MFDELKEALERCTTVGTSCYGCQFLDSGDCDWAIKKAALEALTRLERTVAYLSALNNALVAELKESLSLKEMIERGNKDV